MSFKTLLENVELGYRVRIYHNWLRDTDGWMSNEAYRKLRKHLDTEVEFNAEIIRGIECLRKTASYGDRDLKYTYAGKRQVALPWTDELREVADKLNDPKINFVLINRYPSGNAGIGWHADDERDIALNSTIYSLSIGDTRRFLLRDAKTGEQVLDVELPPGSLLSMEGSTQQYLEHSVPRTTAKAHQNQVRYNLTFRSIVV